MTQNTDHFVDDILRIARDTNPDLWKRTDAIARIIDPAAFADDWIISDPGIAESHKFKLVLMQSVAIGKAQEVLVYLGVNTSTDWFEILTILADANRKI
jgi:hypothetical protein